jgi:hypothetical protein
VPPSEQLLRLLVVIGVDMTVEEEIRDLLEKRSISIPASLSVVSLSILILCPVKINQR